MFLVKKVIDVWNMNNFLSNHQVFVVDIVIMFIMETRDNLTNILALPGPGDSGGVQWESLHLAGENGCVAFVDQFRPFYMEKPRNEKWRQKLRISKTNYPQITKPTLNSINLKRKIKKKWPRKLNFLIFYIEYFHVPCQLSLTDKRKYFSHFPEKF